MFDPQMIVTEHPEYEKWKKVVRMCRAAVDGARSVKKEGTLFLPKTEGMKQNVNITPVSGDLSDSTLYFSDPYIDYLDRAYWIPASGTACNAIAEIINSNKPIEAQDNSDIKTFLDDLDGEGMSLNDAIRDMAFEISQAIRFIGIVNVPVSTSGMSRVEAEGIYPNIKFYQFESMINWEWEWFGGTRKLKWAVFAEKASVVTKDGFTREETDRYVYPHINDKGNYQIDYYILKDGEIKVEKDSDFPTKNNQLLKEIPIWVVTKKGRDYTLSSPIIEPIVHTNRSHFMNSADLERGLYKTANPTFFGKGLGQQDTIMLGVDGALITQNEQADAKYLEFTGSGLGAVEDRMDKKVSDMSKMMVGLMMDGGVEKTATQSSLDAKPAYSMLQSLAMVVETALNEMITYSLDWMGRGEKYSFEINKDFVNNKLDAGMLTSLTQSFLSGAISYPTYFYKLKEGGVIAQSTTLEQESSEREAEIPNGIE